MIPKVLGIAALGDNNEIAKKDGGIPFDAPNDYQHFVASTRSKIAVLGRKNLTQLKEIQHLKKILVLSRSRTKSELISSREEVADKIEVFASLDELSKYCREQELDEIWVLGGTEIYLQFLPYYHTFYLSRIHERFYDCDKMPQKFLEAEWNESSREERDYNNKDHPNWDLIVLEKKPGKQF